MQSEAGAQKGAATSVVPGSTGLGSQGRAARRTAQPQLTRARCEPVKLKQPLLLEDDGGSVVEQGTGMLSRAQDTLTSSS